MRIKEKQNIEVDVITDVICDSCGKSCKVDTFKTNDGNNHYQFEFMTLNASWGFNSNKDMEHWSAQICEQCVNEQLSFIKFKKDENK